MFVKKYLDTNNLKDVVEEQNNINKFYRQDISKYDEDNTLYIKDIFDLIPSELNNQNKRFIQVKITRNTMLWIIYYQMIITFQKDIFYQITILK